MNDFTMTQMHDVSLRISCSPQVAILMCTYQGEEFLPAQLESLERQSCGDWVLHVSDDGSTDATLSILEEFRRRHGERVRIWSGPRCGFAANFMSLVCNYEIQGRYFAFCDQDDVWLSDKLERSIAALSRLPEGRALLYGSRTRLIDTDGNYIGLSPLFLRAPSFGNALVQSIAGGNTMMFNNSARQLLLKVPGNMQVVSHDWLVYLLVTGSGGAVIYDSNPTLLYRQHNGNLIGSNMGMKARFGRVRRLLGGGFRAWTNSNVRILEHCSDVLYEGNLQKFERFRDARNSRLLRRVRLLLGAEVYRQTTMGSIGLAVAAVLNKV